MLFNEPSPLETKVLTRRFGLPNSASIDTYLATEGYRAFLKAARMKPEEIIAEVKVSNLRGQMRADTKKPPLPGGQVAHNGAGGRAFAAIWDLRPMDCRAAGRASRSARCRVHHWRTTRREWPGTQRRAAWRAPPRRA